MSDIDEVLVPSKVTKLYQGGLKVEIDGVVRFVPEDLSNRYYRALKKWIDAGGTVTQEPAPSAPDPVAESKKVARDRLNNDELLKTLVKVVATKIGMTPAQLRNDLLADLQ